MHDLGLTASGIAAPKARWETPWHPNGQSTIFDSIRLHVPRRQRREWISIHNSAKCRAPTMTDLEDTPKNRAILKKPISLGRFCKPSDVGNGVAFLASDEAEFITGVQLAVDGGRSI
jgi:NAD(P)-dependent dehydrogenase (short-subunit alcohol dehydrogenase family)